MVGIFRLILVPIILGFVSVGYSADSASEKVDREPASSLQTKKEVANQGIQEPEAPTRLLNGEWRNKLSESGFDFEAFYFWNGFSDQNGGVQKGAAGFSVLDISMHFDFSKLMNWTGGSFHLVHHTHGGRMPGDYVGDAMGTNAYSPVYRPDSVVSQAFLKQVWGADDAFDFVLGIYDYSSEFFITDSSLIFMNNGFVFNPEVSPMGTAILSVYPYNAPGARFKWVINKAGYLMLASIHNRQDSGDSTKPSKLSQDEGNFNIIEAGYQQEVSTGVFNKYALGVWNHSKVAPKNDGSGEGKHNGLYLLADQHLNDKLALFVRLGAANKEIGYIARTIAAGLNYSGLFGEKDSLGLGVSQVNLNKIVFDQMLLADSEMTENEQVLELVYRNEVVPGIVIMPDLQMIKTPGFTKATKDATVATVRLELSF